MRTLPGPDRAKEMPASLSLEKPAGNLASLVMTNGLEQVSAIVLRQWSHADQFGRLAKYGIRPIDRLLFYGPPGNGKTMASQWLADKIGCPLYRVQCEQLVGSLLGATGSNLAEVMRWLAGQRRCVVLFDEVEQLFRGRQMLTTDCGHEFSAAMTIFWQFLDRWKAPTLFVMATNLPDQMDQALVSRIDLRLEFGPPTPDQCSAVICYWQEVLHEFGSADWAARLLERVDSGSGFASFREVFQSIQHHVRAHVAGQSC